ncbi:radical SAM protein [Leptospira fluminis]|uniref:Radical SAM protein n=1 Tax=Leptospira fluminis TaxID=2484979 RepID=A0A4R9GP07_9LEPT|nr:GTP 3',8-cyclase MoaA [Leptospira fluminis]TGK17396.1 radical SAM protein [Leptospira fluminis]
MPEAESRKFEVLRVSVTSSCGFGCVYCAPGTEESEFSARPKTNAIFLSPETFRKKLEVLSSHLKVKEVHLTGGEPTNHKGLSELVRIASEQGIPEIALTSNGFFADGLIQALKSSGLTRMNFSLDSLSPAGFSHMTGRNLSVSRLLSRIEEAADLGFPVKLNSTIVRGYNEDQILPLLKWAGVRKLPIRYLELMRMGPLVPEHSGLFVSSEEIRKRIQEEFLFEPIDTPLESTARYYLTSNGFVFGLIANHTEPFCEGCNRLRMDATGKIYGCLSDPQNYDLPEDEVGAVRALGLAMQSKKSRFIGSELSMKYIGG